MKQIEIKKWKTKLKRQKAYYQKETVRLKREIIEQPSLYNENVAQCRLLQAELHDSREHIHCLLNVKPKGSKIKDALEFFKKVEIKILIDRNISLQNRCNDLELRFNKLQFFKATPLPYVVPSKRNNKTPEERRQDDEGK